MEPPPLGTVHARAPFTVPARVALKDWVVPAGRLTVLGEMLIVMDRTLTTWVALAFGSARLVAVMVTLPDAFGAVKSPELVMLPAVADQVTVWFEVPSTVAEKVSVSPWSKVVTGAEIETFGLMVTVAVAVLVGSAALVAVTVQVPAVAGAVNTPALVMLPALQDQVFAVLAEPVTAAVKVLLPLMATIALVGEIVIPTPGTVTVADPEPVGVAALVAVTV